MRSDGRCDDGWKEGRRAKGRSVGGSKSVRNGSKKTLIDLLRQVVGEAVTSRVRESGVELGPTRRGKG